MCNVSTRSSRHSTLRLLVLSCICALLACVFAPVAHGTDARTAQQLAKSVSITWQEVPLGTALDRLAETQSLAIWRDRRIDPNTPITLSVADQPLVEVFMAINQQAGAAAMPFAGVVYVGPQQTADELATLAALARQTLEKAPGAARAKLLKPQSLSYPRLSEPRRLLTELASSVDAKLQNEQSVPHDLWPAAKLPSMTAIDRAVLWLAGFDLTCRVSQDGSQLEIVPINRPIAVAKQYRVPTSRASAFKTALAALTEATSTGEESRPTITARVEDHERLRAALSDRPTGAVAAAAAIRAAGEQKKSSALKDRRFTLTIENKPLAPVLNQLAAQLNLQLEWDAAIPDSQSGRNALVSCQVNKTDLDGLLKALLEPVGLISEREERRISIRRP